MMGSLDDSCCDLMCVQSSLRVTLRNLRLNGWVQCLGHVSRWAPWNAAGRPRVLSPPIQPHAVLSEVQMGMMQKAEAQWDVFQGFAVVILLQQTIAMATSLLFKSSHFLFILKQKYKPWLWFKPLETSDEGRQRNVISPEHEMTLRPCKASSTCKFYTWILDRKS